MFLFVFFRSLFRSVWRWTPVRGPQPESCFFIKLCLKCLFWNYWLHTVSSVINVSHELVSLLPFRHFISPSWMGFGDSKHIETICFWLLDMIAENALEEITKNMDPNQVIMERKEVQLKWASYFDSLVLVWNSFFGTYLNRFSNPVSFPIRLSQFPALELDKFLEDVRWGKIEFPSLSWNKKMRWAQIHMSWKKSKNKHKLNINICCSCDVGMGSIRWLPSACPAHSSLSKRLSSLPSCHPLSKRLRLSLQSWRPGRWELEWFKEMVTEYQWFKNKSVFSLPPCFCVAYYYFPLKSRWVVTVKINRISSISASYVCVKDNLSL